MEIVSVKTMIETAIVKSRKLKEGIVISRWEEIVDKLALKSTPIVLKEGTLYVYVEDSIYLHHMSMNKNKYLQKIEEILKSDYVKDIRFKVGKVQKDLKYDYREVYINNNSDEDENISIDKNSLNREENVSIEEMVDHLKKMAQRREEVLLKKGYKKCNDCGSMFKGHGEYCYPCKEKNIKDKNINDHIHKV
ncbi:MAG: DUF721 domain-containing protein [Cetobacterium sp.]|uniref:DUF721 domain-containing protein n=1 Tax=Cetobacterium sp. TaxID=2071632 RepID=UPI003F418082